MIFRLAAHDRRALEPTIDGFKYLINNRGTIARDAAKKMCLVCAKCKIESCRE